MFKNSFLAVAAIVLLGVGSVMAGDCNNDKFYGTYTRVDAPSDVFGDGTVIHQYVYNLTLNSDGTAIQYWTGLPDYQINFGTGTQNVGSWKCKNNGQLIVTLLGSSYSPVGPDGTIPAADDSLSSNTRYSYLFKVNNPNSLTRIQSRVRTYAPNEDPTNPSGGVLGTLNTTQITYTHFVASDADLTAP